ncbi:LPS-assembly protein LptD [Methylotenera mobilis]|uniref:LPS-assembly protein LptD n=1 Tax=Methylotenera mobilis (strain JLW8 / ATCC BAA-1282 / DSM 17540) TaxID=583345 RepID=C6WU98_METML|nr:LPS-assembly protein LptD [Methylotenera mobilis]ACT47497.1 Organic solvent tolerance protein [Methylotenera mobilis JLW8]
MLKNRFLAAITPIVLAYAPQSHANENTPPESIPTERTPSSEQETTDGIVIDGDKLELHLDRKMRAIGNAEIHRGKQTAYGDIIEYNVQNDELHVTGNARVEVGGATLSGPELRMRLSESIGEMRDASIIMPKSARISSTQDDDALVFADELGNEQQRYQTRTGAPGTTKMNRYGEVQLAPRASTVRGNAEHIYFEGEDKKRLTNARYTTCEVGVNDWYIKASEIKLDDYTSSGSATNARVEFKGVPLLYTPWIEFSFNNQRKTGLLAPTMGSTSRSGFEVLTPFYWNIAPNMDATLGVRALSKRGVQLQGEFRYMEENFSGTDNIEYLPSDSLTNENRYFASLKHQHRLGNGWSAGYSLDKVSDSQYFSELSTRIVTTSRINLPQQFNVDYADENWSFNAIAQKFQTLDNVSFPYERLPQMTLSGGKTYGDMNLNLYTQLVAFDNNNNSTARPTGTRFTAYPSITLPMSRPYGYITPKLGVHYTSYNLNNVAADQESLHRTLPIFSLDSGLYFDRDFKIANRGYSQTIEPRLFYVYIPDRNQAKIPVFDSSVTDLNFATLFSENQFTGNDRINNANQLSFALTTRFIESSSGTQRLSASIGQRYYFADQQVALDYSNLSTFRKNNSSDVIAGITGQLRNSWKIDAFWQYNTDDSTAVRTTITSRYNPEPGKVLNLSYSYRQDLLDQFNISSQWPLGKGWYGIGRMNYSMREKNIIESLAGLEYDAGCWQARGVMQRVTTATADANYALFFQLELGGLASIGANPLTVIKRNVPGYVGSNFIPDNPQSSYYE